MFTNSLPENAENLKNLFLRQISAIYTDWLW
jgi:hypothetical protein